jgi:hypothetical protein
MQYRSAEAVAARMLDAQERLAAYQAAQWARRSWVSRVLWRCFH